MPARGSLLAATMVAAGIAAAPAGAHQSAEKHERLPVIGPAPEFALTTHLGDRLSLGELRGQVVAVTFIYATCRDSCPVLMRKLAAMRRKLGSDFGTKVHFVAITVDPEVDTPEVLRHYAESLGANGKGWSFLTGTPEEIRAMVRSYGAFSRRNAGGDVDHLYLTSLVDRNGTMRVQYLGYRFDAEELLRDLRGLMRE
ncbi:MAG TPA: SCO family protein [Burkholderiales bacterium]|nr:SCO family protein [Burkholderiales bacterium]